VLEELPRSGADQVAAGAAAGRVVELTSHAGPGGLGDSDGTLQIWGAMHDSISGSPEPAETLELMVENETTEME